jgi:serine/threonine protein kinase
MEIQVLRIIDQQRHDNIIDLVAFYSWRGELNCVFPFVKLNLHAVLHNNWKPESMAAPARFPKHWLWEQMILVADALQTIHNPPKQPRLDLGTIVGFHFDLKPKNILVTPDGILKITDFGQSMVKMVEERESAYGTYVGGDFAYGPPEVAPTRNEIKELRATVFSPSLQSLRQLPDPSTPPSTASRKTSGAASHVGSHDSRRKSSIKSMQGANGVPRELELAQWKESFAPYVSYDSTRKSSTKSMQVETGGFREFELAQRKESFAQSVFAPPSRVGSHDLRRQPSTNSMQGAVGKFGELEPTQRKESFAPSVFAPSSASSEVPKVTVKANYDVWSLACIMTEVLAFIFEGGAAAVKDFERLRKEEDRDLCFHNGAQDEDCLKSCVKKKFDKLRVLDHADATFTTGQSRSYLSDVVGLLERMLIADPWQRLSSERVVDELKTIDINHQEDNDPDADILRFMRKLGAIKSFKELGYWRDDGIVPFYNMQVALSFIL